MDRSDFKEFFEELGETIEGYEDEDEFDQDDIYKMEDDIDSYRNRFIEITENDNAGEGELEFAEECLDEIKIIEDAVKEANLKKLVRGLKKLHNTVKNALGKMEQ